MVRAIEPGVKHYIRLFFDYKGEIPLYIQLEKAVQITHTMSGENRHNKRTRTCRDALKKTQKGRNDMKQITESKTHGIPFNLQFFADGDPEPGGGNPNPQDGGGDGGNPNPQDGGGSEVTLESLMAEIATLKADNVKLKSTNDKLCQSEGELRKQLRAKMTAEEQAKELEAQQKAEHEEYVSGLEKKIATIEATARYIDMGFDPEKAAETAAAELDGDKETVNANIKAMMAAKEKKMEQELREKLMKDMPLPQSGNQSNIDYDKQATDALNAGDTQAAALAILNQSQSTGQG